MAAEAFRFFPKFMEKMFAKMIKWVFDS
jgi:hypothetical protein